MHQSLMRRFSEVLAQGDFAGIQSWLADTAVWVADGVGRVARFPAPMVGGARIAQLLFAASRRYRDALRIELTVINGRYAAVRHPHRVDADAGRVPYM